MTAFVGRMSEELVAARPWFTAPIETVFIGGGTPTLLPAPELARLLTSITTTLPLRDDVEFTVEANPETVTAEIADTLVRGGVGRVSLGAQSFRPDHLRTLERRHDPDNVVRSYERLQAAGVDRINIDLIFGIPGQTLAEWQQDLDAVLALEPSHISAYALTYEPGTPLIVRRDRGAITPIDERLEAQMYELACRRLAEHGYEHYEISNWSRPGHACRHNLLYWTNRAWWPFGPSAAGHWGGSRWRNAPRLTTYLESGPLPLIGDVEQLDADGRVGETFMVGLRLMAGMSTETVDALLAEGTGGRRRAEALARAEADGLLVHAEGRWRLSRRGRLIADTVLAELL